MLFSQIAGKISEKKNWGSASKGMSSQRIALDKFAEGGELDYYHIASFLRREGECYLSRICEITHHRRQWFSYAVFDGGKPSRAYYCEGVGCEQGAYRFSIADAFWGMGYIHFAGLLGTKNIT